MQIIISSKASTQLFTIGSDTLEYALHFSNNFHMFVNFAISAAFDNLTTFLKFQVFLKTKMEKGKDLQ